MNSTVLCSFDNVDLAEIAVGKLRGMVSGLQNIEISRPVIAHPDDADTLRMPLLGPVGTDATLGVSPGAPIGIPVVPGESGAVRDARSDYVPLDVNLRITCDDSVLKDVEGHLINLGALNVRTVPGD